MKLRNHVKRFFICSLWTLVDFLLHPVCWKLNLPTSKPGGGGGWTSQRRQPLILAEFLQANYLLAHSTQTTHTQAHTHTENINGVWKTPSDQFSFEQKQTTGCLWTSIRAQCVSEVNLYLQTGEHITAASNATAHRSRTYHQPSRWFARGGTCINSHWEAVSRTPGDRSPLVSHSVVRMDVSVWIFTTPNLPSVPTISPQVTFYSWHF